MKKKEINPNITFIFKLSQLWWVIMLFMIVWNCFIGMDSGWLVPALSNHEKIYGLEAVNNSIGYMVLVTFLTPMVIIPIFQVGYIIWYIIISIKNKKNKNVDSETDQHTKQP